MSLAAAQPAPKPGSLEGTIVNSVTGQPVKKAKLVISSRGNAYMAISDAGGQFRITGVAPASYNVRVECPGYVSQAAIVGKTVRVAEEQAVTGFVFKLTPYGVISGKVVNPDGDPIAGIGVYLVRTYYENGHKHANRIGDGADTDDRGEYRIFDVPAGSYYLAADSPLWNSNRRNHSDQLEQTYARMFFPGTADLTGATLVKMTPGADLPGMDFHLSRVPVFHIRGRAVDAESGEPVSGSSVDVRACDPGLTSFADSPPTLPNGTFDIAEPPGFYCLTVKRRVGAQYLVGMNPVVVSNKDLNDVAIVMQPAVDIPGTFVYEGPPAVESAGIRVSFSDSQNVETKPGNRFLVHQAEPGPHELRFQLPAGYYVKSISYGGNDVSSGEFQVTGASPLTVTLASDSGRVAVTVQDADGNPAVAAVVWAAPEEGRHYWFGVTRTQAGGLATIDGMAPGKYQVFVWMPDDGSSDDIVKAPEFRKLLENRAVNVTVPPNGKVSIQAPLIPASVIADARSKMQ